MSLFLFFLVCFFFPLVSSFGDQGQGLCLQHSQGGRRGRAGGCRGRRRGEESCGGPRGEGDGSGEAGGGGGGRRGSFPREEGGRMPGELSPGLRLGGEREGLRLFRVGGSRGGRRGQGGRGGGG